MRDHCAVRSGAACPVYAPRADDGVCFNGERREEENRSQRCVENRLREIVPSVFYADRHKQTRLEDALDDDTVSFTIFVSPENIPGLRTLEANCAASYFRSWAGIPIRWRGTSRRPIPDNWHIIGQRSSPYHLAGNRNAGHPVNAILNYASATLESEIRIKAVSEGYDPTIGIMHEGSDGCRNSFST
jgi:CRISPR/Cas system-associated endonuclease Cas1